MEPYSHQTAATAFEPTAQYTELRAQCPLHHEADHDPPFYILTRFDDIVEVMKRPDLWKNGNGPGVFYQEAGVLGSTDEPDHSRHRLVLRPAFLPTAIQRIAPRVREIATELLDRMAPLGEGDFIELFAAPFPALVIAEVLGVRGEDREEFRAQSDRAVHALTGGDLDAYRDAKAALEGHISRGLDDRDAALAASGAQPTSAALGTVLPNDIISRLAIAIGEGTLRRDEALHLGYQILVAGHETTTSLLGMMLHRLLERPAVMAQLRDDPSLLPSAVEEAVRFDSPVHGLFRTNAQECALHGETLPADTKVQMVFASANRDPEKFSDPDEFVVGRDQHEIGRHLGFGWGIHYCIGAPFARLETAVAFELIFPRMLDIELAGEPARNDSFVLHGLTYLPIRWKPAASATTSE